MGSQILIHEEQPTIATTNISLKSIAYNNNKNYRTAINALVINDNAIANSTKYTKQLTTITTNLSLAANILMGCIGSLMRVQGNSEVYNTVRAKYNLGGVS